MAEHQLPKLTVRVRFPSSAPENYPWSGPFFASDPAQQRSTAASVGPSTGPTTFGTGRDLRSAQPGVEGCRDRLVGHPTAVLIDQGGGGGVVSHAGHQVTQAGTRLSGQCVAGVSQVVKMEVGDSDLFAGLPPARLRIEVSAMPRLPVLVDKDQPVRAIEEM